MLSSPNEQPVVAAVGWAVAVPCLYSSSMLCPSSVAAQETCAVHSECKDGVEGWELCLPFREQDPNSEANAAPCLPEGRAKMTKARDKLVRPTTICDVLPAVNMVSTPVTACGPSRLAACIP